MGRVDDCLLEHRAALDLAERSGLAEARARALGGLGDAEYPRGDIIASGHNFRQCIEESRRIGLGGVEVANLPMYAAIMFLELELRDALDTSQKAAALAVSVGQKRAEFIAHQICMNALLELGRPEEARPHFQRASSLSDLTLRLRLR